MTAISVQIEQLRQDLAVIASQQLEIDKRLKSTPKTTGISKEAADAIFDAVKKALDKLEAKMIASHGSVHRAAINEIRDSALAATMLGKATFTESVDTLKSAVEHVLAGTGSKAA